jgi:hypothetical protein
MDNALHFPELPNAPHHVHKGKEIVESLLEAPNLLSFSMKSKKWFSDE